MFALEAVMFLIAAWIAWRVKVLSKESNHKNGSPGAGIQVEMSEKSARLSLEAV